MWGICLSILVAIIGWGVVHSLNCARDREAKRRDIWVQYLIEACRKLEFGSQRGNDHEAPHREAMESALADIQLMGTPEQGAEARKVIKAIADPKQKANWAELVWILHKDLRSELALGPAVDPPVSLRMKR